MLVILLVLLGCLVLKTIGLLIGLGNGTAIAVTILSSKDSEKYHNLISFADK